MRRLLELDDQTVAMVIEDLRTRIPYVTRRQIAAKLGSRVPGDTIDQRVSRYLVRNPAIARFCGLPVLVETTPVELPKELIAQLSSMTGN